MKLSQEFLSLLQQRLKIGNKRGVHLNAIPGKSKYKFDISRLAYIQRDYPQRFIDTLLSEAGFRFKIKFGDMDAVALDEPDQKTLSRLALDLNSLMFQNNDIQLEKGINTFGFGYPLLVRADQSDGALTVSPLVMWSLKIEKTKELNTWVIKKTGDDPIYLNEVLINHIQGDIGVTIDKIPTEMLDDNVLDKNELQQLYKEILDRVSPAASKEFQAGEEAFEFHANAIPDKETLARKAKNAPFIHWGGVFSLFTTQMESIICEYDRMMGGSPELPIGKFDNKAFQRLSSVNTDPSQQGILTALKTQRNLVIQGPPGTGKSQTLTAIIVNALENGRKTLIVCEKRTALEVIAENLRKKNLKNLSVIVRDVKKDRKVVVETVRSLSDGLSQTERLREVTKDDLQSVISKCENLISVVNEGHSAVSNPILEHRIWTDVVGEYLRHVAKAEKVDLSSKIQATAFSYTLREYRQFEQSMEEGERLYGGVADGKGLGLHDANLIGDNPYEINEKLHADYRRYEGLLSEVERRREAFEQAYRTRIRHNLENKGALPSDTIAQIAGIYVKNQSNKDFYNNDKTGSLTYTFGSIFSKKKLELLKEQQRYHDLYAELIRRCSTSDFLEGQPPETHDIQKIYDESQKVRKEINDWKDTWEKQADDAVAAVGGKEESEFPYKDLAEYDTFRRVAGELARKINVDGWAKSNISQSLNPSKILRYCKDFIAKMGGVIEGGQERFLNYYHWFNYYNKLTSIEKRVVDLIKGSKGWKETFFAFYLDKLLSLSAHKYLPADDKKIHLLSQYLENIDDNQIQFIQQYWKIKQINSVLDFNSKNELNVNNLYNKRGSKYYKRNTLREIIRFDFKLFTDFFPIVLTTPDACSTAFEDMDEAFDIVLFDEASQLKVEDTLPAMLKGKQKIVAGDEHQMPPSSYFGKMIEGEIDEDDVEEEKSKQKITLENVLLSTESLLEFASSLSFVQKHLDFHYRSQHPHLIEFSNRAFYKGRLCAMPAKFDYKPIEFLQVNGIYRNNVNDDEADAVIGILEHNIEGDELGNFPSVGIATYNVKQRDYILEKIRDYANKNKAFANKLLGLEESGLFVKNLENIQGDERDIIIMSTTYGKTLEGKFFHRFGPINLSKGYKLLNVIVTRAKFKMYVCTSIPEQVYSGYRMELEESGENNRKAVFFAYLAYAKAVSEGDEAARLAVLEALRGNAQSVGEEMPVFENLKKSSFENTIMGTIQAAFPEDEVKMFDKFAGFDLDIVLHSKEGDVPPIVIECDGNNEHRSEEAYLHDIYRQAMLERYGIVFYRTWSVNWWKNHKRESEKLLDFIKNIKKERKGWKATESGLPFVVEGLDWFLPPAPAALTPNPLVSTADGRQMAEVDVAVAEEEEAPRILPESIVVLRHLSSGKTLTLQTSARPEPSDEDGIRTLDVNSPLVQSMLGHALGDTIKVGSLENYYEIVEVR